MAKPKALIVDWLVEARHIKTVIDQISGAPGLLVDLSTWRPDRTGLAPVGHLMRLVRVFLTDRISKKTPTKKPKQGEIYGVFTDDPAKTWPLLEHFTDVLDLEFTDAEQRAFVAHNMLAQILQDGWISSFAREQLPLQVASIQGESVSASRSKSASKERPKVDRRSPLAKLVAEERAKDKDATASEVLHRLVGSNNADVREAVQFKGDRVQYRNPKGVWTSISHDRFETIFSQQKPSTG